MKRIGIIAGGIAALALVMGFGVVQSALSATAQSDMEFEVVSGATLKPTLFELAERGAMPIA